MRKLFFAFVALLAVGCTEAYQQGVPAEWRADLDAAIASSERGAELKAALETMDKSQRKDMAYLIINMPDFDRNGIDLELLKENVEYANIAREQFVWAQQLPEEVYLCDVLPYAVVDEVRDSWRKELYGIFAPEVEGCTTMYDAVCAVNANIPRLTGVDYNTLREKTNQSPSESMRQGMASCTGLSILLVDAYRAVGIPARFVGTASWHDNRGNHSWTEVWLDGEWRVTEYYFPSQLDHLWFMPDASKAKADDRTYAIYATRFAGGNDWFPMVWADEDEDGPIEELPKWVGAENVTQHYIDLAYEQYTRHLEAGTHTFLRIAGYKEQGKTEQSGDRVAMGVDIFRGTEQMGGGLTAGELRDMNDFFSVLLPKNTEYELRYYNAAGELQTQKVELGEEPIKVDIFLN
ncbi:MAG: transglutaminase domain-containing protein [Alistipes sp.]|nr:transglutaminase domain-containing protein [Alistipes sp.]